MCGFLKGISKLFVFEAIVSCCFQLQAAVSQFMFGEIVAPWRTYYDVTKQCDADFHKVRFKSEYIIIRLFIHL